jgi:hypothetical protein
MGLGVTGPLPWMDGRVGCSPTLLWCRTPMTSVMTRHQRASAGRGIRLWGDKPPNRHVPSSHLSGRFSRDSAESLPERVKFSCAFAPFISLSPFTDFGYVYVNPAGALSLCRAVATNCRASMMAMSWACSRLHTPAMRAVSPCRCLYHITGGHGVLDCLESHTVLKQEI